MTLRKQFDLEPCDTDFQSTQNCLDGNDSPGSNAVVAPGRALFKGDEAGLPEQFKVVANRGLGQIELRKDIAYADLALGCGSDEFQQAKPCRVRERLKNLDWVRVVWGRLRLSVSDESLYCHCDLLFAKTRRRELWHAVSIG